MENKIKQVLTDFIFQKSDAQRLVTTYLNEERSGIIEVIGDSGAGKSLIFEQITKFLLKQDIKSDYYIPKIFKFNHFRELIHILSDISDSDYEEIVNGAEVFKFTNKFDFFYYFTNCMIERQLFKSAVIQIFESYYLDQYCKDFLQYLTQYSLKEHILIIAFSRQQSFLFSEMIQVHIPADEDIQFLLKKNYPTLEKDFQAESEMISSISEGNLFVIQHLMENFYQDSQQIDLSKYLEKKITIDSIIENRIKKLNDTETELLFYCFLLDTMAKEEIFQKLSLKGDVKKSLQILEHNKLLFKINDSYLIKKIKPVETAFWALPSVQQKQFFEEVITFIREIDRQEYTIKARQGKQDDFLYCINYLQKIFDYSKLQEIYELLLQDCVDDKKRAEFLYELGICKKRLGNLNEAVESFREALKLFVQLSLPLESIVHHFADCLLSINSSAFALEVIKKYLPSVKDTVWKWKMLMLKAKIETEIEYYEQALQTIQQANHITSQTEDLAVRNNMLADAKKQKGLIFYYNNELNKAKTEFEEAEELYLLTDNTAGLAAIYNNLGGIAIFRGEWKFTETLFKKSLKYEQLRYNLNGISYCYNNLGSLWGDQSEHEKAIFYLNEALKIQKLLSDSYQIATFYFNIGLTNKDKGDFEKATEALNKSYEMAMTFHLYKIADAALNAIGAIYFKSGDWAKAIEYYEQALQKAKSKNFYQGMCESYNNIGELYEKKGEFDTAWQYYNKSKDLLEKIGDDFLRAEIHGNLGSVLTSLHEFGEAYSYLIESYDFFKSIEAKDEFIEASQKLAHYFMETRNQESANYHLESSIKLAEEMNNQFYIGKAYFLKARLESANIEKALEYEKIAIEKFILTNNSFDLSLAKYDYASMLLEKGDWEQALQIANENRKMMKRFNAIHILEKNDILIEKIKKKYSTELEEARQQDLLLNDFYEITRQLNAISNFDSLLESAIDKLIDFSSANGGLLCLYKNHLVSDSWEYLILKNLHKNDKNFTNILEIIEETFKDNSGKNIKQPRFAPEFNNIITFPLTIRNQKRGVICLFIKGGSNYFTEKMLNLISALCNQIVVIVDNISYKNLEQSHAVIREELAASNAYTNIIGKSPEIHRIFSLIEKVKDTPTTILIEGPSGTGKELIARAIHYNSNRKQKKFIAQYCGSLPETLLESELFGHVKGSFTGATQNKRGLFEIADGGTFFLDEIADISLSTQAKLLRFLQEGEVKKVGATTTEKVNVRVICATNVSLKDKVLKGEFREDLYYRLNVIRIEVPSLKQRKSDIPFLAIHFLDKYSRKIDKKVNGISDDGMRSLISYNWPGNIRELENEIERAVTLADHDSYIKPTDLSDDIFRFKENKETISLLHDNRSLKDTVEEIEIQLIRSALDETDWNQSHAAKKLGLSRQGLIKKMHRYDMKK